MDPEDTPFTKAIRNVQVRGVAFSLSSSVVALLCKPRLKVLSPLRAVGDYKTVATIEAREQHSVVRNNVAL